MQPSIYHIYSSVEALAKRISLLADTDNAYLKHNNPLIKQENLRHNIAQLIAQLSIISIKPAKVTVDDLQEHILKYNAQHGSNLTVEMYRDRSWIQVVLGKLRIATLVMRAVNDSKQGKQVDVPEKDKQLFDCVCSFSEAYIRRATFCIDDETLNKLFSQEQISLLTSIGILSEVSNKIREIDLRSEYCRYLRSEVLSMVWLLLKENEALSLDNRFQIFQDILMRMDHFPETLDLFLQQNDQHDIANCAYQTLIAEAGMLETDTEFQKLWLDRYNFDGHSLFSPIPQVNIDPASPLTIAQSYRTLGRHYQGTVDYSSARSPYYFLLRLVVNYEKNHDYANEKYPLTLSLVKDTSRPFLSFEMLKTVQESHPHVLAYFLLYNDLIPVLFYTLNNLKVSKDTGASTDNEEISRVIHQNTTQTWKDAFSIWIDIIKFNRYDIPNVGYIIGQITTHQAELYFSNNSNLQHHTIEHYACKERYEYIWIVFSELRRADSVPSVNARVFPDLIADVFRALKEAQVLQRHNLITLPAVQMDISVRLHKLCNSDFYVGEISEQTRSDLAILSQNIVTYLSQLLYQYHISEEVERLHYFTGTKETVKGSRGSGNFGFEILDWAYLYGIIGYAGEFAILHEKFITSITFKPVDDEQPEIEGQNAYAYNLAQIEKIKSYVKSLAISLTQYKDQQQYYKSRGLDTSALINTLSDIIIDFAIRYSKETRQLPGMDILENRFSIGPRELYYEDLADITFKAVNYLSIEKQLTFYRDYFENSNNLAILLQAINTNESAEVSKLLSALITKVDIQKYIDDYTIRDVEAAIVEAVNSDKFFDLTTPLLDELLRWEAKHPMHANYKQLAYNVRLLLAFKKKDINAIQDVPMPEDPYLSIPDGKRARLKQFFVGLHRLYNEHNFTLGIQVFETLVSLNPEDYDYQARLFYGRTMKAQKANDYVLAEKAYRLWNVFSVSFSRGTKTEPTYLQNNIYYTKVIVATILNDYELFEPNLKALRPVYRFDEDLIANVYEYYAQCQLPELAGTYLIDCESYYRDMQISLPDVLIKLISIHDDHKRIERLARSFREITSLAPDKLIRTIPDKFNGKSATEDFILFEILRGLKVLLEKVKSLDAIKHENKYNDLLLAVLKMRIPLWGLEITDQARVGSSAGGIDLGELDFLISASGEAIAVLEALVINSLEKEKITRHIHKCEHYHATVTYYYVINYYTGTSENFEKVWQGYKEHVNTMSYPEAFNISQTIKDIDDPSFVRNIKAGLTKHGNVTIFHIMCNISAVAVNASNS